MRCPTLAELPPPPPGKTGWPWTEESPQLPDAMPDGRPWPRISIVMPCYNRERLVEEAIRSVLLQGYPNLEYIIIDGGSTDGTLEVIHKYDPWLSYWISERDDGVYDAVNKGIELTSGEFIGWLNSDDMYIQDTFRKVIEAYMTNPICDLICGDMVLCREKYPALTTEIMQTYRGIQFSGDALLKGSQINSCFISKRLHTTIGKFNPKYRIAGDLEFLIRLALLSPFMTHIDSAIYQMRAHDGSLTFGGKFSQLCSMENISIGLEWLPRGSKDPSIERFCRERIARGCFPLVLWYGRRRHWREAGKYLWHGCRFAPLAMATRFHTWLKYRVSRLKN